MAIVRTNVRSASPSGVRGCLGSAGAENPTLASDPLFTSPGDPETLAGLAEAKPEAFHRFFDEWFPRVYAWALRDLGSRPHAEAVTRRSLHSALAEVRTVDPALPLAVWLLSHLRREIAWARRSTPP